MSTCGEPGVLSIDVRGLACPEPVVRTRQALERAAPGAAVKVVTDSQESRDNIVRFAERTGHQVTACQEDSGVYSVEILKVAAGPVCGPTAAHPDSGMVVLVASDRLGRGDDRLGRLLMSLFLRTLAERPAGPGFLLLANNGVKLALAGSDDLASLQTLANRGVDIMVCGTCLDFFGEKENVRVGTVSNMYEIVELLFGGARVLTL
jgi:selenium metabolism protein YedF